MASLTERQTGYKPLSYEVSVPVLGGQFVIYDPANPGKVKVAGAHATNVLGMAHYDGKPGVEFDDGTVSNYNVPINAPNPRWVACPHMGVYEVVNDGDAVLNPGDPVETTANGKPGATTAGMVGGLAVVGFCLGLVDNRGVYSAKPVAVGAKFRIRLGRV